MILVVPFVLLAMCINVAFNKIRCNLDQWNRCDVVGFMVARVTVLKSNLGNLARFQAIWLKNSLFDCF